MEFPRYATFAQSFPASIPYSEAIGFIARVDPKSEDDVDYPFYVTAHEVAHQWWAHQVIGGNVQGATVSVGVAGAIHGAYGDENTKSGPAQMRRFLKYEMNRYLIGRSLERRRNFRLSGWRPGLYSLQQGRA